MKKIILFLLVVIICLYGQTVCAEETNIYNDILDVLSNENINPDDVTFLIIMNSYRNDEIYLRTKDDKSVSFEWYDNEGLTDYSSLSQFQNLTDLHIQDLANEIILPTIDNLRVLKLHTRWLDFSVIGDNFKDLEELDIWSNEEVDFRRIKKLESLKKLGLIGDRLVTNLSTAYYPNNLEVLDLSSAQIELDDTFDQYSNDTLKTIWVSDINNNVLKFISKNKSLEELFLANIKDLDLDMIKNLEIHQLTLLGCTIYNDHLERLYSKRLNINNHINKLIIIGDIGNTVEITGGSSIKELYIVNGNLKNLHISSLKKLEKLNLSQNNNMSSLGFIAYLPNLKELNLSCNEFKDYNFLENCKNIDKIYLDKHSFEYYFTEWHLLNKIDKDILVLVEGYYPNNHGLFWLD